MSTRRYLCVLLGATNAFAYGSELHDSLTSEICFLRKQNQALNTMLAKGSRGRNQRSPLGPDPAALRLRQEGARGGLTSPGPGPAALAGGGPPGAVVKVALTPQRGLPGRCGGGAAEVPCCQNLLRGFPPVRKVFRYFCRKVLSLNSLFLELSPQALSPALSLSPHSDSESCFTDQNPRPRELS